MTKTKVGIITIIRSRLAHPFPFWSGWVSEMSRLALVSTVAIIITILLLGSDQMAIAMQFGGACVATGVILRASLALLIDEQDWTVGRAIIFYFGYVMLLTAVILLVLALNGIRPESVMGAFLVTGLACIIPITLDVFQSENSYLRRSMKELETLHFDLTRQKHASANQEKSDVSVLVTPLTGEPRTVSANSLIHVRSRQNYCEICLESKGDKTSQKLLRLPLQSFLEQSSKLGLLRTHRSWAINPKRVIKADGNAQGYVLTLTGSDKTVPVSRRYTSQVREQLNSISAASFNSV
jgi:hypothetical protein